MKIFDPNEEVTAPAAPARVIRKVDAYMVDGLGRVNVFTTTKDEATASGQPVTLYRGSTVIGLPGPGGQVMQMPLEFEIANATSVADAFDKFEEAARTTFEANMAEAKAEAEAERNKIVVAPEAALSSLSRRPR